MLLFLIIYLIIIIVNKPINLVLRLFLVKYSCSSRWRVPDFPNFKFAHWIRIFPRSSLLFLEASCLFGISFLSFLGVCCVWYFYYSVASKLHSYFFATLDIVVFFLLLFVFFVFLVVLGWSVFFYWGRLLWTVHERLKSLLVALEEVLDALFLTWNHFFARFLCLQVHLMLLILVDK